jgi:protocatechuate 4,5-dioxygenase beta chain
MADIVGGIGISHIPSLAGLVLADRETRLEPDLSAFHQTAEWLAEQAPDVVLVVYNDHGSEFGLDAVSTFAMGAAEEYLPTDEGQGRRDVPAFPGNADLSWHIIDHVVPAGFDLTICQALDVDHGLSEPLVTLCGKVDAWPFTVIPLAVNVVQQPTPSAQRCYDLGRAIGDAIRSYPHDARVVIIGTGGMSHQLQGLRAGHINSEFDNAFLDKIVTDPSELTRLTNIEYIDLAGSEGAELVMWLVMRGALGDKVTRIHRGYRVPVSSSAAGVITMEPAR